MGPSMRFQRLDDWLRWLEGHHPQEIELGLDRIRAVARRLDLLSPQARVISVAGTNGKGSCVLACTELLRRAGQRVGSYTSPHLHHYCERIQIDGTPVEEAEVCAAFAAIDGASDDISLTYFEFGTLAAFHIFAQRRVDIMVLEVGLGGRLDAVNLLDADVAVVTSIDLDHQDWLGDNRDSIGREKAGIFRSARPALCADPEPPAGLLAAAREAGVRLQCLGREFGYELRKDHWSWWLTSSEGEVWRGTGRRPALPLPSLAAALQAVAALGFDPRAAGADQSLSELALSGRFQQLWWRGREWVLDVAHNPAAARFLADRLESERAGRVVALVAMMADKDRRGTLSALIDQVDTWYLASLPELPRAADTRTLSEDLASLGDQPAGCGTVSDGINWLLQHTLEGDRIVILGSFYTVAAALEQLERLGAPLERDMSGGHHE